MLVLSRRRGQRLIIGNREIIIEVVEVRPNGTVRLGIEAPEDISVHREEIYDRIEKEGKA
jgi:carbon storage regulator